MRKDFVLPATNYKKIMEKVLLGFLFGFLFVAASCTKNDNPRSATPSGDEGLWLVPPGKVLFKDLPKDRIPSIDNPQFIPEGQSSLKPDDIVLAARILGETRIYPVRMMDAHEIVNDQVNDYYFSITYCPRTGSGMLWNREINGKVTEFGVSGMLYNKNLMPYDRNTESIWSQMKMQCVNGILIGMIPETKSVLEIKFSTLINAYPNAMVLNPAGLRQTGFLKNDPVDGDNNMTLPLDQQYFGIVKNDRLLLFNFQLFKEGIQIFTTNFQGSSLVVCGSYESHFYTAFLNKTSADKYKYSPVQNELPVIMKDDRGNRYDLFGEVVEGPDKGSRLETATAYVARSFAWDLFFSDIELFKQ